MMGGGHRIVQRSGAAAPSVMREIVYGVGLGVFAGLLWKMHHWSEQRRTKEFYDLLEKGHISVVAQEDA